jgi:hypothetical protein
MDHLLCYTCSCKPKTTYTCGFKRDVIICDKGVGTTTLSPYLPDMLLRWVNSFEEGHGFIKYENQYGRLFFCSLLCLNSMFRIVDLAEGMNDYDKEGILTQFRIDVENHNKKSTVFSQIEEEEDEEEDDIEIPYDECDEKNYASILSISKESLKDLKASLKENKEMKQTFDEQMKARDLENRQQKEYIEKIQQDENKWKEVFEKNKQKEIDTLKETIKAKDREIFCLIARNMELEGKLKD